ncbi:MAG: zinc ribbon domain-containing protein [Alphaproteobacteria bacterium]|nr:zinc ribbon domain-containing protein [Alphaproteobacteria bacterium]
MPLYTYRCKSCDTIFETLVMGSDLPACDKCGSADLERQLGTIAAEGKSKALTGQVRAQAAREGHFSNYSRSELKRR